MLQGAHTLQHLRPYHFSGNLTAFSLTFISFLIDKFSETNINPERFDIEMKY
jgi:hypothetical protein